MADASNGINFMALMNPQFAAQQQSFSRQQAIAQAILEQGNQPDNYAQLANPGGLVVPYSPLQGLAKAGEKAIGTYLTKQNDEKQLDAYKQLAQQMGPQQGTSPGQALASGMLSSDNSKSPTIQEQYLEAMQPGMGKASFENRMKLQNAGPIKAAETQNTPYITPQGTYIMGNKIMGSGTAASDSQPPLAAGNPPAPVIVNGKPQAPANMDDILNAQTAPKESNVMPNKVVAAPAESTPMAADGKPLLPNISKIPAPDPSGTPNFKTENTKTGVEQTIQDQKDAAEGNKAFAATAQSLGQEKARLDNLIQVYKDVKSGTLTAQNPELFNKLAALGFHDDPASVKDLAGIQNATQNHILQVIQQIKDTNSNAGGGAPTRVFGSEISQLLENGESTKGQPEALWNVIGQAKGVVDHHLDMVNGWNKAGGLGNRLAGGYTMRPDDFAQQFSTSHDISDYRDKALKEIGPFKGMAGNNDSAPTGRISIIAPDGSPGTIDKAHLQDLLSAGGKLAQ